MRDINHALSRRHFLHSLAALTAGAIVQKPKASSADALRQRTIPSSGENVPVIGLGTWRTFSMSHRESASAVLQKFVQLGGRLIDTSPMYGDAERAIGVIAKELGILKQLMLATKIWTNGEQAGRRQLWDSQNFMGKKVDVAQIHNLMDWRTHLPVLREMKEKGQVRYIGITHYLVSAHEQLEKIIRTEPMDFLQVNYNIAVRNAENRLLPSAADKGVAVIINRPYVEGTLFRQVRNKTLPTWASEFDCHSFGQFFLKFILSNPNVTCAIPATTKVHHLVDNMGAGHGRLPDATTRKNMVRWFDNI